MTRVLRGLIILILVGFVALAGASWSLSGLLLFRHLPRSDWKQAQAPQCTPWLREAAYADLRPSAGSGTPLPVDLSCDEALTLAKESRHVATSNGATVHYALYPAPGPRTDTSADARATPSVPPEPPLFLHVHGITGNHLHGARYLRMAERLGFQLAAMDLSNHGLSQRDGIGAAYGCREDADVVAVVGDLMERHPQRDLYLHATSMGAMALANAIPRLMALDTGRRIVALSLENPIPSVRDGVTRSPHRPPVPDAFLDLALLVAGWRAGYNFESCRPLDNVRFAKRPVLVQWSQRDDLVPRELVEEFVSALPGDIPRRLEVFSDGGHSAVWNGDPVAYEAQTKENWLAGLRVRDELLLGRSP